MPFHGYDIAKIILYDWRNFSVEFGLLIEYFGLLIGQCKDQDLAYIQYCAILDPLHYQFRWIAMSTH